MRHRHLVQFYRADEQALSDNLDAYVGEGLRRGEAVLVVARAVRVEALRRAHDASGDRLVCLDARETLEAFLVDGLPDWQRFQQVVGERVRAVRAHAAGLRAYGEMVGLLWEEGRRVAAVRLEEFWNALIEREGLTLYCGYPIDVFGHDFQLAAVDPVLCTHTHLLPSGASRELERALEQAMEDVLGASATGIRRLMKANFRPAWAVVPRPEAMILWLRNNLPEHAEEIVARARRSYFVAA